MEKNLNLCIPMSALEFVKSAQNLLTKTLHKSTAYFYIIFYFIFNFIKILSRMSETKGRYEKYLAQKQKRSYLAEWLSSCTIFSPSYTDECEQ